MFTIGKLADIAGVSSDTLRYYEREGLIEPAGKSPAGYRLYDKDSARRLRFIKQAQQCGFTLAEIRELLVLRGRAAARCGDVRKRAIEKKGSKARSARCARCAKRSIASSPTVSMKHGPSRDARSSPPLSNPKELRGPTDHGPEYQANRDGRGRRSAVDTVLRNAGACCLARPTRLDRLRCKARLRARPRVRSVHRARDLCACAPTAELRRGDTGANLADRRVDHHMPPLPASGDRTNAAGRLPILL
jgi:DNA-binding transcriptional MerR regulator